MSNTRGGLLIGEKMNDKIVKCPYCNENMVRGVIQGGRGVFWAKKEKKIPTIPPISNDAIMLTGGIVGEMSIEAYKCEKCKKIIINY